MNILLDTHALIWFLEGNNNLSNKVVNEVENKDNNIFVSIASLWEISIKIKLKKLSLNIPLAQLGILLNQKGIDILPIVFEDILINSTLDSHHNDPFDRIIISQSIRSQFPIISYDKNFKKYGIEIIN